MRTCTSTANCNILPYLFPLLKIVLKVTASFTNFLFVTSQEYESSKPTSSGFITECNIVNTYTTDDYK